MVHHERHDGALIRVAHREKVYTYLDKVFALVYNMRHDTVYSQALSLCSEAILWRVLYSSAFGVFHGCLVTRAHTTKTGVFLDMC